MKKSKSNNSSEGILIEVAVSDIKPYPRNVRDNNPEAVNAVAKSIEKYGYQNPIIVDQDMVVISGHTRLLALKQLKRDKAEVIMSSMTPDEAKQFRVVDNRTSEYSQWDKDKLQYELREFVDQKYAQSVFPEIKDNVKMQDVSNYGYTQEQIDQEQERLENAFENKSAQREDDSLFVDIPCPHCQRKFAMLVKDVLHKYRVEAADRKAME